MLKSNHNRLVALSAFLFVASATMLFGLEACARQGSDLKIVDLQGYPVLRIDAVGSVFDSLDTKVAVINDREGTLTFLKDHRKMALRNDPAIQRDNDRYIVTIWESKTMTGHVIEHCWGVNADSRNNRRHQTQTEL